MIKYGLKICTFLFVCLPGFSYAQESRIEQWKSDLKTYQTELEQHHIDLYNQISQADFEHELHAIEASVETKTDLDLILDLMRLTQRIGDGHTAVSLRNQPTHYFPFGLRYISNGWRIVKAGKVHENLLGKTLVAIDGHPVQEVAEQLKPLVQYVENPNSVLFRIGDYMSVSEYLYGLHLIKDPTKITITVSDDDSVTHDFTLDAIDRNSFLNGMQFSVLSAGIPQITKPEDPFKDFLWYTSVKGTQALYICFQSFPAFEEMEEFGTELYQYILENKIKQVIVDLRGNSGGDLYVGLFFAYALNLADPLDWKNGIYLMTDQYTYSAATSDAALFRQLLNAKVVGMPTGSNPAGYQDLGEFTLPNSNLVITYSKRHFRLQREENTALQPDEMIPHDWAAYKNGRDVMLEWIVNDISSK